MNAHSKISPSSADRWINCPASIRLSADAPPDKGSVYAAEGSVAHTLAETLVSGTADEFALMERVGTKIKHGDFDIEITDDMVDGAILFRDTIDKARAALKKPAKVELHVEKRVAAKSVHKQLWGRADAILFQRGNTLYVWDYKYGKGHAVEAEENYQETCYGIGAMDTVAGTAFDKIVLGIVQPRAPHPDGPVREWVAPKSWFKKFTKRAKKAIKAIPDHSTPLNDGSWCVFCPVKPACPKQMDRTQELAEQDFKVIPSEAPPLPSVSDMTPEKMGQVLRWEKLVTDWMASVRVRAKEMLEADPSSVPGFKLVAGRAGNRKYIEGAEKILLDNVGASLGEDAVFEKKLLSPAKMEKLLGKKEFAKLDITERAEPGKSIVPDSDKRPAVGSSAESDFKPVWPQD